MERRHTTYLPARDACAPVSLLAQPRGSSLVELLVSTVFVSILMGMSYSFARAVFQNVQMQEAKSDAQEVVLMAVDLMTRELRLAGFSAAAQPLLAVRVADPQTIQVATDFDGDGQSDGTNELVTYSYNEAKQQLVRATGNASPQPLVSHVAPGGVAFSYFDAAGAAVDATGGMALDDRRRIHRIDVRLQTELPNNDGAGRTVTSTVSASVCLRNQ